MGKSWKDYTLKEKFTSIFENNYWKSKESVSGSGSELKNTIELVQLLPHIIDRYNIKSILDIGCGDFNWMKEVDLPDELMYIGVDVVDKIIEINDKIYGCSNTKFYVKNVVDDELFKVDLIFMKDVFIHLSFDDIKKALENIRNSGSKYYMIGMYTNITENKDIETGGGWRAFNLMLPPFNFPQPIEHWKTRGWDFCLWNIKDI